MLTYKQGVDAFRVTDRLSEGDPVLWSNRHHNNI
jgi:hypothetical protein